VVTAMAESWIENPLAKRENPNFMVVKHGKSPMIRYVW
jgi:hypothetical protein